MTDSQHSAEEQQHNREKWVAALRSGEYRQGFEKLNMLGGFCCLGVACDLALREGVVDAVGGSLVSYDGLSTLPPISVRKWLGLEGVEGELTPEGKARFGDLSLVALNDVQRAPFAVLADAIEGGYVKVMQDAEQVAA